MKRSLLLLSILLTTASCDTNSADDRCDASAGACGDAGGATHVKQDAGRDASTSNDPDSGLVARGDAALDSGRAPQADAGFDAGDMTPADAGSDSGSAGADSGTDAAEAADASDDDAGGDTCKAMIPGIYAVRMQLDVWWMDEVNTTGELYDAGRAKLDIYFRTQISNVAADGTHAQVQMRPCGMSLPTLFASANCNATQLQLPDALWNQPGIPTHVTSGSVSGFDVGDALAITQSVGLLGISLNDGASFPTSSQTSTFPCPAGHGDECFPDHDGDGKLGITVNARADDSQVAAPYLCNFITPNFTYRGAALSLLGAIDNSSFATSIDLGIKSTQSVNGALEADCASAAGDAESGAGVQARAYHCVRKDGVACAVAEEVFVDSNIPIFHTLEAGETPPSNWMHPITSSDAMLDRTPSVGSKTSIVRIADLGVSMSCADVRATP